MDASRLLLILVAVSASQCSVKHKCQDNDVESYLLLEGEAFYFVPYIYDYVSHPPHEEITWYKNTSKVQNVSSNAKARIHSQGAELFLLDLVTKDSGLYTARHIDPSGECNNYYLNITVFKQSYKNHSDLFYGEIHNRDANQKVPCPDVTKRTCNNLKGNFTWYKDFHLIKGEHQDLLWVNLTSKLNEGLYTCVCSWTHNRKAYKSSGSRQLKLKEKTNGIKSISPDKQEQFADEESVVPMVVRGLCVVFFCVFVVVLVRCFVVELVLFFRPCFSGGSHNEDEKLYDAFVVYQTQNLNKTMNDTLCRFVTNTLPSVLEGKCGYRLFIHGRDDKPGENSLELAEDRMKQSRRLIVILTLDSEPQCEITEKTPVVSHNSEMRGFDWQVGLQHALVRNGRNTIVIQLGDAGFKGNTCLCQNLQRLASHSAPIRWREDSQDAAAWNSRFWKRVRYLMPAVPVRQPPSAVV